ncbi:MAG TPA: MEDS domain-containing protein, partial [Thermoanaerobaculia bacterium]|nr:MEDS domain-containing protein [Thermoanaerobaculia bacterium]
MRHGDHACFIYDTLAELSAVLVPFLRAGLAAGDRCIYIGPAAGAVRLESDLRSAGVPVDRELERGAAVMLGQRESWLQEGRFDPWAMMDLLRQAEQQALDDGFAGLRATWDMTWVLAGRDGAERLVEYEAHLNRFLAKSRTTVLCRYARSSASPELIQGALHTHPLAVLGDQLCPNVFYEPAEMVLGDHSPDERIDWMIGQLRRARLNEEKLEEVTRRLAHQGAALERADRAKDELLAMLAHELRNPLGTISNALQVLRLRSESEDESWRRAIDTAERQVLHQALLVDDLLEASRVTRGEIELNCEELDLVRLVCDTVEGYREVLRGAGLTVDLDLPDESLWVRGDRMRLSQALSNLLHNATKFSEPGGRISVRAGRSPGGGRAEVAVRDDGQGISPEVLPYVFEIFTQADHSLDRVLGGLGVGLAVVKGLVEMHGGEVQARSEGEGKGAELTMRLPLLPEAERTAGREEVRAAAEPAPEPSAEHRRILVVEDNPDAAAMMRDFLELAGHEVELAATGSAGVEAARQFHPEVVLCDLGLPGMNGYEVAAQLRRDPATAAAKLIAVTGYGREEDRRRSREAGFDLHLTKPVDPVQLRRELQRPRESVR